MRGRLCFGLESQDKTEKSPPCSGLEPEPIIADGSKAKLKANSTS